MRGSKQRELGGGVNTDHFPPDPNFRNYDHLHHAQFPYTGHGVHAHSWRANRDADVRRYALCVTGIDAL